MMSSVISVLIFYSNTLLLFAFKTLRHVVQKVNQTSKSEQFSIVSDQRLFWHQRYFSFIFFSALDVLYAKWFARISQQAQKKKKKKSSSSASFCWRRAGDESDPSQLFLDPTSETSLLRPCCWKPTKLKPKEHETPKEGFNTTLTSCVWLVPKPM